MLHMPAVPAPVPYTPATSARSQHHRIGPLQPHHGGVAGDGVRRVTGSGSGRQKQTTSQANAARRGCDRLVEHVRPHVVVHDNRPAWTPSRQTPQRWFLLGERSEEEIAQMLTSRAAPESWLRSSQPCCLQVCTKRRKATSLTSPNLAFLHLQRRRWRWTRTTTRRPAGTRASR